MSSRIRDVVVGGEAAEEDLTHIPHPQLAHYEFWLFDRLRLSSVATSDQYLCIKRNLIFDRASEITDCDSLGCGMWDLSSKSLKNKSKAPDSYSRFTFIF
ncbi:hypothetical protein [Microcoleus vaginatus]|uniref:hypothetical protein n=1 Tax=Microcoleus vaginatus TaxID=119532 RepID=UPI0016821B3C|nr:hypothetical protein [Microcoleus sp. FACHB-84]MBD2011354.1 hypothetical protein [Microcoleus sp. FACHB-45]